MANSRKRSRTVIENIERPRQAYPTLEAIYFLTPCKESVLRLIDDFTVKGPMYKGAHVHFTSGEYEKMERRRPKNGFTSV
jgi:syntaxin-binding protein 1